MALGLHSVTFLDGLTRQPYIPGLNAGALRPKGGKSTLFTGDEHDRMFSLADRCIPLPTWAPVPA